MTNTDAEIREDLLRPVAHVCFRENKDIEIVNQCRCPKNYSLAALSDGRVEACVIGNVPTCRRRPDIILL
eukprot:scaffold225_cov235-Pinguiococcus_pyrenoidosus.AAC.7